MALSMLLGEVDLRGGRVHTLEPAERIVYSHTLLL